MPVDQQVAEFEIEHYSEHPDALLSLDQFSPSPTLFQDLGAFHRCAYNAPFFAVERSKKRFRVVQGCCNHWDCPRCGILVAKSHYGRIVTGARKIAETQELYFITVTCRGKEITVDEAKKSYLAWTSKFLDACYSKSKRMGLEWFYVQVTELQKRGHPHSHILSTFCPSDQRLGTVEKWSTDAQGRLVCSEVPALRSDWMLQQVTRSGLGSQYDISQVRTVEAASRYVAKYMFKDSQFRADFPKRWKRVRYSQSWPKMDRPKTNAFVLLSQEDWRKLENVASVIDAEQGDAYESANWFLRHSDAIIHEVKEGEKRDYGNANE